jgi:hypothetical protein
VEEVRLRIPKRARRLDVVIREVPGEVATIAAQLIVGRAPESEVSDHVECSSLDQNKVLQLTCALPPEQCNVILRIQGFYCRFHSDRKRHPLRIRNNVFDRQKGSDVESTPKPRESRLAVILRRPRRDGLSGRS